MLKIARFDRVARDQFGLITHDQLVAGGLSASAIGRLIADGTLIPIVAGVYRFAGTPLTGALQAMATLMRCGDKAALSSTSALRIHGVETGKPTPPFDILVPYASAPKSDAISRVRRTRTWRQADVDEFAGLRIVSVERATYQRASELAALRDIEDLVLNAIVKGQTTRDRLAEYAHRVGPIRNRGRVLSAIHRLTPNHDRIRARDEASLLDILRRDGLPEPIAGYRLQLGNGYVEADAVYLDEMIWIEAERAITHLTATAQRRDPIRQNRITVEGFSVLRFTDSMLRWNAGMVSNTVRAALVAAGPNRAGVTRPLRREPCVEL